jgi:hypothetical protein
LRLRQHKKRAQRGSHLRLMCICSSKRPCTTS